MVICLDPTIRGGESGARSQIASSARASNPAGIADHFNQRGEVCAGTDGAAARAVTAGRRSLKNIAEQWL